LSTWWLAHPTVAVLVRDNAGAYALAGRAANPDVMQVAQRFHLVRQVRDALQQVLRSQRGEWPRTAVESPPKVRAASGFLPAPVTGVVCPRIDSTDLDV
jgi:hypothetical protein